MYTLHSIPHPHQASSPIILGHRKNPTYVRINLSILDASNINCSPTTHDPRSAITIIVTPTTMKHSCHQFTSWVYSEYIGSDHENLKTFTYPMG